MDRILFTAELISQILHDEWIGSPSEVISNIQIDSRSCGRGTLFIPLKGERTDGHLYFDSIASQGASLSLVNRLWLKDNRNRIEELADKRGMSFLPVDDTLSAMQKLAVYHKGLFPNLIVVAITGSNGKTTTKDILGTILSEYSETVVNLGNYNSDIGLPYSVFAIEEKHKIAVFEMGMNRVGEIALLASIVKPQYAVITNIGTAHIGLLGSQDNIAKEKKDVFKFFAGSEVAVIPHGDKYTQYLQENVKGKICLYGPSLGYPIVKMDDDSIDGVSIEIDGYPCHFSLLGKHNFSNLLAACTVAFEIGVSADQIARAINKIQPAFGRAELIKGRITLLRDCYNSNPDSLFESLQLLKYWAGRSVIVLGDMLELGELSRVEHSRIGSLISKGPAQAVFLLGELMEEAFESIKKSNFTGYSFWTKDFDSLKSDLLDFIEKGDLVVLKGSRSMALERLTEFIID